MKNLEKTISRIWFVIFFFPVVNFIGNSPVFAQYINKGMWYHQQPTSQADNDIFFGGSSSYEGWCGPSALAMVLHYFIPNIHQQLYDKYGLMDYHPTDNRGGLPPSDPFCYSPFTTYPFGDFLAHNYLGYHVTTSGVGYYGLRTIIEGVDTDLKSYTANYAFVPLSEIRNYLNDGYIIIMNTKERHYISITGWEGSLTDPNQRNYYIWDGWKYPLGMELYTYKTDIVGNSSNLGTAQNISVYTITEPTVNAHFRDQIGDGTVLALKFTPVNLPETAPHIYAKGVWVWGSTIKDEGIEGFIKNIASHWITDLFLLVKGTSGIFNMQILQEVLPLAHSSGIKVHVWVMVLNDKAASESGNYLCAGKSWINAADINYRNYFINDIIKPLCTLDIDGIHLDCIRYPGNANDYHDAQEAIHEYCKEIKSAIENSGEKNVTLSATIVPEGSATSIYYGQEASLMTPYMNFIVLTTYTHNYFSSPSWVGDQVEYFKDNVVTDCAVWACIQSLDDDGNFMTPYEMKQCADYALTNGSTGIVYFRYPLKSWQWELLDKLTITSFNEKYKSNSPASFELFQNYPNPFNPSTIIEFRIVKAAQVTLKVYDVLGRDITTLVNKSMEAGLYKINFEGGNLPAGIYLGNLSVANYTHTNKMMLVK